MRSALCLSGQPKGLLECSDSIIKNIIEPNNCDVFIHCWWNPEDVGKLYRDNRPEFKSKVLGDVPDLIEKIYKPHGLLIEPQIQFPDWVADSKYQPGDKKFVFAIQSMFYSMRMAYFLKNSYQAFNNITYDCVMRSRFDLIYHEKIDFSKFDLSHVITKNTCKHTNYCCADHWAFSNDDNMSCYCNTFTEIYRMYKEGIIWCGELFLGKQLQENNIQISHFDIKYDLLEKT